MPLHDVAATAAFTIVFAVQDAFEFPGNKKAAVSLSFDDARVSQIDHGLPILDRHNIKATFYVTLGLLQKRLHGWRDALSNGHEIGNHSLTHPCSGNYAFSRKNALEEYTLERMEQDILAANEGIHQNLGITPQTFAYPCGQTYVGRGSSLKSYIPLVAKYFIVGRSAFDEMPNYPPMMDLAQAFAMDIDCCPFEKIKAWVDQAIAERGWAIFLAHDVGVGDRQIIHPDTLDQLCCHLRERDGELWSDTVANVGRHIASKRNEFIASPAVPGEG